MSLGELEHQLLDYLKSHAGEPLSRDTLLRDGWGYASGVSSRTVDVTIQRLRKKVEPDPKAPRLIVTVRGRGYAYGTTGDVSHTAPSTVRPADSGPFVGREDAVAAVRQWFDGRSRLLTLHGPIDNAGFVKCSPVAGGQARVDGAFVRCTDARGNNVRCESGSRSQCE